MALTVLGESVAIGLHSPAAAVATVAWYGSMFAILAWWRFPVALIGLVVALPLITIETGFGDVRKTLSADKVALAVVCGMWMVRRVPWIWRELARVRAVGCWGVFLGIQMLSVARNGLTVGEAWGVARDAVSAIVFIAALDQFADPESRTTALSAGGVAAGLVAALAIVEWVGQRLGHPMVFYFKHGTMLDERVAGSTIGHVNFLGAYLSLLTLASAGAWLASRGRRRRVALASCILGVLALLYARSMGAWLGLVAGAGVVAWCVRGDSSDRVRRSALLAVLAVFAIGGTVIAAKAQQSPNSFGVRLSAYRIGLAALADRPLLGYGADGYAREYYRYEDRVFGRALTEFRKPQDKLSAHSSFLDVAVDRGLLGLAAFVTVLGVLLVPAFRVCSGRQNEERLVLAGVLAGMLAFTAQALTENLFEFSKVAALFWIMAAMLVRLTETVAARPAD